VSNVEEVRELYQNDPEISVGLYARMIAEAEARDNCTCGHRDICTACVLYQIEASA